MPAPQGFYYSTLYLIDLQSAVKFVFTPSPHHSTYDNNQALESCSWANLSK